MAWASRRGSVGEEVSRLYALNSAGAVVGGALAGFYLIETLGQRHTVYAAAAGNLGLAAAAFLLSRWSSASDGKAGDPATAAVVAETSREAWLPVLCAFAAGAAALLLEVVWIRLFALIFGSATQSFTVIVCAFITGITIGAAWAERLLRPFAASQPDAALQPESAAMQQNAALQPKPAASQQRLLRGLFAAGLGAALFTAIAQAAYVLLPWMLARLRMHYGAEHAFLRFSGARFSLCLLVMAVPTVLSGLLLPFCAELASARRGAGDAVGRVFSANAAGAVLGAALAGTVLVPHLSLRGTLLCAEVLYLAIGLAGAARGFSGRGRSAVLGLAALATLATLAASHRSWDLRALDAGEFRRSAPVGSYAAWAAEQRRAELTFHEEGSTSTVSVLTLPDGKRYLKVNGKTDASNWGDVLTAAGSPAVGVLAAEHPRHALVVGFGSGVTADALLKFGLDVDVVEIEPAVLHAAPLFTDVNDGCLERVRVHVADARTFLQVAEKKWDVIVNEPSNPWVAGVSSLFTREFFQAVSARLDDGGSFVQWFHLYDMDDDTVRLILRTLASVFPEVSVWHFENDIALLARKRPMARDLGTLQERFGAPAVRSYFNKLGVYDLFSLLSLQLASEEGVRKLLAGDAGPLHEDDLPRLEYHAPRAQFDRSYSFWLTAHDERVALLRSPAASDLLIADVLRARPPTLSEMIDFTLVQSAQPWSPERFRLLYFERVLASCREPWTLGRLVLSFERAKREREAERALAALETLEPSSARTMFLRVELRLRRLGPEQAARDPLVAGLLASCGRAPESDPYRKSCRALAQSLKLPLE